MKSIIKLMVVFVCVVSLVACGKKDTTVSANKDGVLYEAGVGVSFYAQKLVEKDKLDQLSELYKGELEASEVSSLKVKRPALESGLKCYEYKGSYVKTGLKFIHLVYFDDKNTYVYGYEANRKDFRIKKL